MLSCTDSWDEHFSGSTGNPTGSLMESIEKSAPDFAKVVKAVKYDRELSSDNSFTVWAPLNINTDSLLALDSADVVNGFIKNHMARYSVLMNGDDQNVVLINNKKALFTSSKFASSNVVEENLPCTNGVLHVIDNSTPYSMNIFEAIKEQYKKSSFALKDSVGGSLYTFLRKYDADSLDEKKSVSRGYDSYGNKIWVDSVVIRNNTVLKNVWALIYEEDSNYIAIIPSPEAFNKRFNEYKKLLNFNQDLNKNKAIDGKDVCDSLAKHYANMFAMNDLFYNVSENKYMEDSLKSTTYGTWLPSTNVYYRKDVKGQLRPTHDILAGLTPTKCSNGTVYYVDEYPMSVLEQNFYGYSLFLQPALLAHNTDKKNAAYTQNTNLDVSTNDVLRQGTYKEYAKKTVTSVDPETGEEITTVEDDSTNYTVRDYTFFEYRLTKSASNTYYSFFIPYVLSGTYDISLVTVAAWGKDGFADATPSENGESFKVRMFERDDKGEYPVLTSPTYTFLHDGSDTYTTNPENKVDTTYIGEYTFKNTYYGRGTTEDSNGVMIQIFPTRRTQMLLSKIILTPKLKEDEETANK